MPARLLPSLLLAFVVALAPPDATACGAPAPPEGQAFEGTLPLDARFLLRAGEPGPEAFELRVVDEAGERRLPATLVAAQDDAGSWWLTPDEPLPAGRVVAVVQQAQPDLRVDYQAGEAVATPPAAPVGASVELHEEGEIPGASPCGGPSSCPRLFASLRLPRDAQGSPFFELAVHRAAGTSRLLLDRREALDTIVAVQARDCAAADERTVGPEPLQLELSAVSWAGVRSTPVPLTVLIPAPAELEPSGPADEATGCSHAGGASALLIGLVALGALKRRTSRHS